MLESPVKIVPSISQCMESIRLFDRVLRLWKVGLRVLLSCLLLLTIQLYPPNQVAAAMSIAAPAPPLQSVDLRAAAGESSYWIWLVLPRLFPEYLPDSGGYLSLGFPWQPGEETPMGIQKLSGGVGGESRQRLDCLACHQAVEPTPSSVDDRLSGPSESPYIKAAFEHAGYATFLRRCAEDPRFEPDYLLPSIRYNHRLGILHEWYYRWVLIPQARQAFLGLSS